MDEVEVQIQAVTMNPDGTVTVWNWHADEEKRNRVWALLGEPDHEAVVTADALAAAQEASQDGTVITGEHDA
jgi:hypothetical protein